MGSFSKGLEQYTPLFISLFISLGGHNIPLGIFLYYLPLSFCLQGTSPGPTPSCTSRTVTSNTRAQPPSSLTRFPQRFPGTILGTSACWEPQGTKSFCYLLLIFLPLYFLFFSTYELFAIVKIRKT